MAELAPVLLACYDGAPEGCDGLVVGPRVDYAGGVRPYAAWNESVKIAVAAATAGGDKVPSFSGRAPQAVFAQIGKELGPGRRFQIVANEKTFTVPAFFTSDEQLPVRPVHRGIYTDDRTHVLFVGLEGQSFTMEDVNKLQADLAFGYTNTASCILIPSLNPENFEEIAGQVRNTLFAFLGSINSSGAGNIFVVFGCPGTIAAVVGQRLRPSASTRSTVHFVDVNRASGSDKHYFLAA